MTSKHTPAIESLITTVREQRVIVDVDLADIYGVPTKALNQAVKRNVSKFPPDFVFRMAALEADAWRRSRSQFVTLNRGQNIKYLPYAFTEHGAIMAANALKSDRASQMRSAYSLPTHGEYGFGKTKITANIFPPFPSKR